MDEFGGHGFVYCPLASPRCVLARQHGGNRMLASSARPEPDRVSTEDEGEPINPLWPRFVLQYVPRRKTARQTTLAVLIAEDEYVIMADLADAFRAEGARIVGTCASVDDAWRVLRSRRHIDVAVLDINLRDEKVYPVADALIARGTRVAFITGYDRSCVPAEFSGVPCFEKPVELSKVVNALMAS
jgi:CheY-like chemotaxis protein